MHLRTTLVRFMLVGIGLTGLCWFIFAAESASLERIQTEKNRRIREANNITRFESIWLGMSEQSVADLMNSPGILSPNETWARTVREVSGFETGKRWIEPSACGHRQFESDIRIRADQEVIWRLWQVGGELQYVAVGFVVVSPEPRALKAIAKVNGRLKAPEALTQKPLE